MDDPVQPWLTRRAFLTLTGSVAALLQAAAGHSASTAESDHLRSRPQKPTLTISPGAYKLRLRTNQGGLLFLPVDHDAREALPLVLALHGAGQKARSMSYLFPLADELGVIVIAPDSRDHTWDVLLKGFGPDVEHIDRTLQHAFTRCNADPMRMAIGGFSDGASYALSLGLANGDLFSHIMAFSPGFIPRATFRGKPRIFVSHGSADRVLPIDRTSHRIVPALQSAGYAVQYREFDGSHGLPPEVAREAFEWLKA